MSIFWIGVLLILLTGEWGLLGIWFLLWIIFGEVD